MGLLAAWSSDGADSTSGSTALAGNDALAEACCVAPTLAWSSGPQAASASVASAVNANVAVGLMMSLPVPGDRANVFV